MLQIVSINKNDFIIKTELIEKNNINNIKVKKVNNVIFNFYKHNIQYIFL